MIFLTRMLWSSNTRLNCLLALGMLLPATSLAEKDKERLDQRIPGHYVRLAADEKEDSGRGMAYLRDDHRKCTEAKSDLGEHYLAEPSGGWPKARSKIRLEYYHTRTRVKFVKEIKTYLVQRSNCDLYEKTSKRITLSSSAGTCVADLDNKTSFGQCDATVHRRMTAAVPKARFGNTGFTKSGTREISGYTCTVYISNLFKHETCVANPPSDFPIAPTYAETPLPGLTLQTVNRFYDAKPESVLLHTEFHEDIFSIPEGLRHLSVPHYENRHKLTDEESE